MLARKARLRKNREFDLVYKTGKSYSDKKLKLYILPNSLPEQRCGFSISKKVSKKAVERNKLKRRLSFIFRKESKKILNSIDIIFVARTELINLSFSEIEKTVKNLLNKAGLYV